MTIPKLSARNLMGSQVRGFYLGPMSAMKTMLWIIKFATPKERAAFSAELRAMPYPEFLKTDYWRLIKNFKMYMRRRSGCEGCGCGGPLELHHSTYEIRGKEHENLSKLKLLCRDCHAHEHLEDMVGTYALREYGHLMTSAEREASWRRMELQFKGKAGGAPVPSSTPTLRAGVTGDDILR